MSVQKVENDTNNKLSVDAGREDKKAATIANLLKLKPVEKDAATGKKVLPFPNKPKKRHKILFNLLIVLAVLPTLFASIYLFFIAKDQYHSSAAFSVRSVEGTSGSDILGMFTQATSASTVSDSYVLLDYILSEAMVRKADQAVDLEKIYARQGIDFFYALSPNSGIEDKVEYWRSMVKVDFDHTSGIINLTVKTFSREQSQLLASLIVRESETLINGLSQKARNGVLLSAQNEVHLAENRLVEARLALREFRSNVQEADPIEGAKLATQIVAGLEQQLTQLNAELRTAKSQMTQGAPRIRVMESQIASLNAQLEQERKRFGDGSAAEQQQGKQARSLVADRIYSYEELEIEREFAEKAYVSVLASQEKARYEADAQQRFLAVFIHPALSDVAQYPSRILNTLLVLLGGIFAWGVAAMTYYNIRDRN